MTRWLCVGLVFAIGPCAETLCAQDMALELDPANSRIEFTVAATLHTVHGTFALKHGTVHFNPSSGAASGLVVVDATSGNSENSGRDHKMHAEILESQRYPEITFTPTKMRFELQGDSDVQVDGIFRLHGTDHPLTLALTIQTKGNSVSARTHIAIPYVEWGLKNPSTFLLHVSDKVEVDVTGVGQVQEQGRHP
ncbi:MAG TPA: YceI family protein [Terriglobales bacterium]|jgi:polyisoprenoid-binding protein YceI|nr:YceI family protein [Terriglobales bacterium]